MIARVVLVKTYSCLGDQLHQVLSNLQIKMFKVLYASEVLPYLTRARLSPMTSNMSFYLKSFCQLSYGVVLFAYFLSSKKK